jgi:hypothetical protein
MAKDFWNISKLNLGIGCGAKGWVDPAPIELMCDYPASTAADKEFLQEVGSALQVGLKKGNKYSAVFESGRNKGKFKGPEVVLREHALLGGRDEEERRDTAGR